MGEKRSDVLAPSLLPTALPLLLDRFVSLKIVKLRYDFLCRRRVRYPDSRSFIRDDPVGREGAPIG